MAGEDFNTWAEIARIDRKVQMPDDPTLRRAAVWWEVYSGLPDERESQLWATYVADAWEHTVSLLRGLASSATWVESSAIEMRACVAKAKAHYDAAAVEWWSGSGDWTELQAEKSRRLFRFVMATQQRLVALMVEEGEISRGLAKNRLVDAYAAGYLSGIVCNWCDANGFETGDERCQAERLSIFRDVFGEGYDESTSTIYFERWAGEIDFVDGMLHAYEDVESFRRWERGIRIHPRMRFYEYLTA